MFFKALRKLISWDLLIPCMSITVMLAVIAMTTVTSTIGFIVIGTIWIISIVLLVTATTS